MSIASLDLTHALHVMFLMHSSANAAEWDRHVAWTQQAHGGTLPPYWDRVIVQSGLQDRVQARWAREGQTCSISR